MASTLLTAPQPPPLALTSNTNAGVRMEASSLIVPCGSKTFATAGTTANCKALTPPASAASTGKRKVSLGKGCGLLDWIRLCRKEKDLPGTGGNHLQVTLEELAKHNTPEDAWTAIRGEFPHMRTSTVRAAIHAVLHTIVLPRANSITVQGRSTISRPICGSIPVELTS